MSQPETVRILCLEDDPGTGRLLRKTLTQAGYSVDLAHDGDKGLTMYRSGSYDVLCVDHQMPGLTGLDIIRILSSGDKLPPIIMITGAGDETVAVEAVQLGASDYVIKDSGNRYFDLIPSVIEGALEKQRLVREKRLAEEALQKSHDELEARVRERTADLARINDELLTEIVQRKEAEDKLKELLETFSNIVKNIPSGLLIYQYQAPKELFLVNVNREATRLTGITVDTWRGQEFDEMWPNARIQGLTPALLNTMATGETFAMECAVFKTDDIERFLRLRAFSMPGDLLGLTFEDITEFKQMERGIQEPAVHGMVPDAFLGRRKVSAGVPPKSPDRALRLLLIADRPLVAGILQKGLIRLGQGAVVVSSGNEALDLLLAEEFSAIVCDLTDSETAGQQAAGLIEDLCRETGISRPPFVLMAEAVRDKDVSPPPGVDLIVEKPIDVGRLLQVLHEVV